MKYLILIALFVASCGVQHNEALILSPIQTTKSHFDSQPSLAAVSDTLESGNLEKIGALTDHVVDGIVKTGLVELRAKGHNLIADKWEKEYLDTYQDHFSRKTALGDHKPWSEWLAKFYQELESKLGKEVCHFLHLDDIWTVNYAITVVFDPTNKEWDEKEYALHFVPFAGCCAYWGVYITCSVATYGAGAWFLVCSPIGTAARYVMVNRIAPPMSDRVYERANRQD